jgi:integrase
MNSSPLSAMTFPAASSVWLEQHSRYIKANTLKNYTAAVKLLTAFLGDKPLCDITITDIRRYQDERGQKAGNGLVNCEMSVLQQILKEARLWKTIEDDYKALPVSRRGAGHSLNQEDEERLRATAFSKSKWQLAAHCITIMLSTTMGFGELRQLRRRDVDMKERCITIREGAKNEARERTIPLNASAFASMTWILDRGKKLGGCSEEHYILPHRPRARNAPWIVNEPMAAITSAFNGIRRAAGLPNFRVYDCRVQAITKLLSNPKVSAQVSREIAGHISQAMQSRYSKQQFDTKKAALEALDNASASTPSKPEPPPPTPGGASPSANLVPPPLLAEIDRLRAEVVRLADRQGDFSSREHPSGPPRSPGTRAHRRSKTKATRTAAVPKRQQPAKNLIVFPTRSA